MYKLEKAKSGHWTLKYENKYIHSKYNPIEEGKKFAQGNADLLKNNSILLYGLGLGYHVKAISDILNKESILYVFEYNKELIKYCKEINPDIFRLKNVVIISSTDEKKFYIEFSEQLDKEKHLIIHKPSLDTIYKNNSALYNLINDFSRIKQQYNMQTDIQIESVKNIEANNKTNSNNINEFINKFKSSEKDYIIAAAGPSIDDEIKLLKRNREKFNIFAVGSVLRTLIDNNIYPDCVVIIDPRDIVKKQFENIDCRNLVLCYCASASRNAVAGFNGKRYIFNNPNDKSNCVDIRMGGTVAVAAIDIAVKCNANKIIMLGQDLAVLNNKSHTGTFEKTYGFKDEVLTTSINKKVKAFDGGIVETTQGYITFRNKIESIIKFNPDVEFINCSKGVYIEGAKHINFQEFCNI